MDSPTRTRNSIFIFLAITLAFSAIFYALFATKRFADSFGLLNIAFMWCPGVAALLTRWFLKIKEPGTGWKPGRGRYWLLAYLLPLAYCLVAYGLIWLTGIAPFKSDLLLPALMGVLVASIVNNISTLGEEIGWRGFLVPQLNNLYGFTPAALVSGIIWAIWHLPALIILYFGSGAVTLYNLVMLTITLISLSFIFAWLRLKSNSIWPAVILHTSHAAFIASFDQLTAPSALSPYLSSDMGAFVSLTMVILAILFWRSGRQLSPKIEYSNKFYPSTIRG